MPEFRKCSLAQESNFGGERAKKPIASSRSPWGFCTCKTSVHRRTIGYLSKLTFVHALLFPSFNQDIVSLGSQRYSSTKLSVATVARSAAKVIQLELCSHIKGKS